jgi:hypothetical protein
MPATVKRAIAKATVPQQFGEPIPRGFVTDPRKVDRRTGEPRKRTAAAAPRKRTAAKKVSPVLETKFTGERITGPAPAKKESGSTPPTEVRHVVTDAVQHALDSVAALALETQGKVASLQLKLATALLGTKSRFFTDKEGEPIKLIFRDAESGKEREMGFYDWATESCRLNRSSLGNYVDAASFLHDHPEVRGKVETIQAAVVLKRAERRKPAAAGKMVAAVTSLTESASIADVERIAAKAAPKKKPAARDTSKESTDLAGKLRDKVWPMLALIGSEPPLVAAEMFGVACIAWATDPTLGKGRALTGTVVQTLVHEYNRNLEAAAETTK